MTENKGDLISREALKEDFKSRLADCNEWIEKAKDKETKIRAGAVKAFIGEVIMTIDNAQTVEETKTVADCIMAYGDGYETARQLYARPQGEWLEIKHRLNLLIGVLYSNQCISENDLKYIEDSIKKLMKGGAE